MNTCRASSCKRGCLESYVIKQSPNRQICIRNNVFAFQDHEPFCSIITTSTGLSIIKVIYDGSQSDVHQSVIAKSSISQLYSLYLIHESPLIGLIFGMVYFIYLTSMCMAGVNGKRMDPGLNHLQQVVALLFKNTMYCITLNMILTWLTLKYYLVQYVI